MTKYLLTVALIVGLAASALADSSEQIGNWLVNVEKDRFGDGDKVIAITANNASMLALRCISGTLTFAIRDPFAIRGQSAGTWYKVSFKGGNHAVINTLGDAVDESMIEVLVTDDMRSDLVTSDEFAFRFIGDYLTFDEIFPAGSARAALQPALKACPAKRSNETKQ